MRIDKKRLGYYKTKLNNTITRLFIIQTIYFGNTLYLQPCRKKKISKFFFSKNSQFLVIYPLTRGLNLKDEQTRPTIHASEIEEF